MSPVGLSALLAGLPEQHHADLLVGYQTRDDAAVFRLREDLAIVSTVDVITPPVDDPFVFGQIAAANSLSDVWAMGGRPVLCLNIAGFPSKELPASVLAKIIEGAAERIAAAGAALGGGHTIEDEEPKFGLAVTGVVDPKAIWTNGGARAGDLLLLTKPLGSGILFNAHRAGKLSAADLAPCIEQLIELQGAAADVFRRFSVGGVTDVTGFGLAGHGLEVAQASDVRLRFRVSDLLFFDHAEEMVSRGVTTGAHPANEELIVGVARFDPNLSVAQRQLLVDPQTSGGLLVSLPASEAPVALDALHAAGVTAARIVGSVEEREGEVFLDFVA